MQVYKRDRSEIITRTVPTSADDLIKMRIVLTLLILALMASATPVALTAEAAGPQAVEPGLPEREELLYEVRWLGIPVGTAHASIKGIKKVNGRDAYELEIIAKTNDFCSRIYKIDDRYISYMDTKELCVLRQEFYRREGRYKKDSVADFDQINHKAYFRNLHDGSRKTVDLPPRTQDMVTMAYYFRLVPVEAGYEDQFAIYNNESIYRLYISVDKKLSMRFPRLGVREVFHVQPYATLEGKIVKKGKAHGYFEAGGKKIPLAGIVSGPVFTQVVGYFIREERP